MGDRPESAHIVIISGMSGSGKSTALNVFEDMGFFCVDGIPVRMVPALTDMFLNSTGREYAGLVIGMDLRQPDFAGQWSALQEDLRAYPVQLTTLFTDAADQVLLRRYATTRRPHPLATEGLGLEQAVSRERAILHSFRSQADLVIDTSHYSIHDLRRVIQDKWSSLSVRSQGMRVHLISFGFKYGAPAEADTVLDLRFLPNPYFDEELRPMSGQDTAIANFVLAENPGKEYLVRLYDFLDYLLPQYAAEGRYRLTLAFGCTGGRHRSVAVTEAVNRHLLEKGYALSVEHRHLSLG